MPTADQRLDQLEPVISELLARQDETAAKVERVSAQLRQLTVVVTNALAAQSDNIEFLLDKTVKLEQELAGLKQEFAELKQAQGRLEQAQGRLEKNILELRQETNQRFDQLFDFLREKLS